MTANKGHRKPAAKSRVDADLWEEFESICDSASLELVHAAFAGGTLRIFIDKPDGGVDLSDCEHVSKMVSALLDVVDFGQQKYVLEVSSPGIDRELYRPRDYERFAGEKIRLTYRTAEERAKRTVIGLLEGFEPAAAGGDGVVTVVVDKGGERIAVPLADVQTARLEVEI